jgi:hypothetical protein
MNTLKAPGHLVIVVFNLLLDALRWMLLCARANAFCERLIGTIRRECLDFLILLDAVHLRRILREWVAHYNKGRPYSSLGPGIPDSSVVLPESSPSRHRIPHDHRVIARPVLGGLHHEYRLEKVAA